MLAGPLRVRVSLDAALAAAFPGPSSGLTGTPDVTITLAARAGRANDELAPFSPAGPLRSRQAELVRRVAADGTEQIAGSCLVDALALRLALRFATQPALLRRGWVLLHAATLVVPEGGARVAHVFAAPSGTGKSTLARRWAEAGAEVLGDEVALVSGGRASVHPGQQVHGILGEFAPLAGVHLLGRGAPRRRRLGPSEAVARLMSLQMAYEAFPDTAALSLDAVTRLVTTVPVFETLMPDDARAAVLPPVEERR